ncbi:hypothetical protein E2562_033630, partial [Oryza meyeriana var. granulata]
VIRTGGHKTTRRWQSTCRGTTRLSWYGWSDVASAATRWSEGGRGPVHAADRWLLGSVGMLLWRRRGEQARRGWYDAGQHDPTVPLSPQFMARRRARRGGVGAGMAGVAGRGVVCGKRQRRGEGAGMCVRAHRQDSWHRLVDGF